MSEFSERNLIELDRRLVGLLQDLVRTPSYVDETHDENGVVDLIEDWMRKNTNVHVERQILDGGRYNLMMSRGRPELVILGHTDTVMIDSSADHDQLDPIIVNGEMWGRGTTDMKSGLATVMQAVELVPDADNFLILFYADEETDFIGMKAAIKQLADIRPRLLVSADGSDLSIGHGCRGLIELRGRVYGRKGHPALDNGNNAVTGMFEVLHDLSQELKQDVHPVMGSSSFNLAYVLGGADMDGYDGRNRLNQVGQAGNVIPDVSEFVIDIRPARPEINATVVDAQLRERLEAKGLRYELVEKRHDLGAWYTDLSSIEDIAQVARDTTGKLEIRDPRTGGYLDLQMLWKVVGCPPSLMFGGGLEDVAHSGEERIPLENLFKERDFWVRLLQYWKKQYE